MGSPEKILICDDEESIINLLTLQLKEAGFSCLSAKDGNEAFKIISDNLSIQLIITDIVMPNMSGYELIETLDITNENLKIIVITGFAIDEKIRKLCTYKNVVAIMAKPWEKDYLMDMVKEQMALLNPASSLPGESV